MIIDYSLDTKNESKNEAYTLKCINNSSRSWYFYVYQSLFKQDSYTRLIAWMVSPVNINVNNYIIFKWNITYCFTWSYEETIGDDSSFVIGGAITANLSNANTTEFDLVDNTPGFTLPINKKTEGSFIINIGENIQNNKYMLGIGMSGVGICSKYAYINDVQIYKPNLTPRYQVAVSDRIQVGTILNPDIINNKLEFEYSPNEYNKVTSLNESNKWDIV